MSRPALLRRREALYARLAKVQSEIDDVTQVLARECKHELTRELKISRSNGFGSWRDVEYQECVICGAKNTPGSNRWRHFEWEVYSD